MNIQLFCLYIRRGRQTFLSSLLLLSLCLSTALPAAAQDVSLTIADAPLGRLPQLELRDPTPNANDHFGNQVVVLRNGNVVVAEPDDDTAALDAGAVHLFDGVTGLLISTVTGSQANDRIGFGGVWALTNGNFLFWSPGWDNGAVPDVGAVTWGHGATGVTGVVSAVNSLIGAQSRDVAAKGSIVLLANGNYVVSSPLWDNGTVPDVGAVTWGNGAKGTVGLVNGSNSLIGVQANDAVGSDGVVALSNGNYVVSSSLWDQGALVNAGAVTWGNGVTGTSGMVSAANSLVGATQDAALGNGRVTPLTNGNYVVSTPRLTIGGVPNAGAVTWGNGVSGTVGAVSVSNSLVGVYPNDYIGVHVTALSNGNYVVISYFWNNKGSTPKAGAVTWGNGTTGIKGFVAPENSLFGMQANDYVGLGGVVALSNGNYVVASPSWDNGSAMEAGAVTWGDGNVGRVGVVSPSNSLVGERLGDQVGGRITALSNGNYVVLSAGWDNGATVNVGAATWGDGAKGVTGVIAASNSLIGAAANDMVGNGGALALRNGHYVVSSFFWRNGSTPYAGAATWGNGTTGTVGLVTAGNSLVGSQENDYVGERLVALTNGHYVVNSPGWNNGSIVDAGAATWVDGTHTTADMVTANNSLVGTHPYDALGAAPETLRQSAAGVAASHPEPSAERLTVEQTAVTQANDSASSGVLALRDGNYVVISPLWENGALSDAGAATWVDGRSGQTVDDQRTVTAQNSLIGSAAVGMLTLVAEEPVNNSLVATINGGSSGQVLVGFVDPNQLRYRRGQQQAIAITPGLVARPLQTGTPVTVQANSDLRLSAPFQVKPRSGNGSSLTLQAGRSLLLEANLTSANGAVTLLANDTAASGVIDAARPAGAASLAMAPNTTLDAGTGTLVVELRDGAGKRYTDSGAITLQGINAGSLVVNNLGTTPNSDLRLAGPVTTIGAQRYGTPRGSTTVAANLTTSNAPIQFADSIVINRGVTVNSGTAAVEFGGAGVQTVQATGATLGNVTHNGTGALRLLGGLVIGGAFQQTAGMWDANGQTLTVRSGASFRGGVYRPDVAPQTFGDALTLAAGATLRVDLNGLSGQFSQLQVAGAVNVTGATLQVVHGFVPPSGASFLIIDNDSNSPVVGTFADLPQGAALVAGGVTFQISYQGGDGNDVVLTVAPGNVITLTPTPTGTAPTATPTPTTTTLPPVTVTPPSSDPRTGQYPLYLPLVAR